MTYRNELVAWSQAILGDLSSAEAAARIEADAATIARLEGDRDVIERQYMSECEAYSKAHEAMLVADDARIAAEAKLARAVEGLRAAKSWHQITHVHAAIDALIAEIEGGNT